MCLCINWLYSLSFRFPCNCSFKLLYFDWLIHSFCVLDCHCVVPTYRYDSSIVSCDSIHFPFTFYIDCLSIVKRPRINVCHLPLVYSVCCDRVLCMLTHQYIVMSFSLIQSKSFPLIFMHYKSLQYHCRISILPELWQSICFLRDLSRLINDFIHWSVALTSWHFLRWKINELRLLTTNWGNSTRGIESLKTSYSCPGYGLSMVKIYRAFSGRTIYIIQISNQRVCLSLAGLVWECRPLRTPGLSRIAAAAGGGDEGKRLCKVQTIDAAINVTTSSSNICQ